MSNVSVSRAWARRNIRLLPLPEDEFVDRMDEYRDYQVGTDEAARCALRDVLENHGVTWGEWEIRNLTAIPDLRGDDWVSLIATAADCDAHNSEKIRQTGTLRDEDGNAVEYVIWAKSDVAPLEPDRAYAMTDVRVDRHNGSLQVQIHSKTTIRRFSPPNAVTVVSGTVDDVRADRDALFREDGDPALRFEATLVTGGAEQPIEVTPSVSEGLESVSVTEAREYCHARYKTNALDDYLRTCLSGHQWRVEAENNRNVLVAENIEELAGDH